MANLEIRRMRAELEDASEEMEMCGHMPAALVDPVLSSLKTLIAAIEDGKVSSICLIAVMPQSPLVDGGTCFISATGDELSKLDELFHISLAQQYERFPPDEPEAG